MRLGVILVAFALAGCGPSKLQLEAQAARDAYEAAIAACERSFPDRHRKPVTPRVKCFNEANLNLAARGDPNVDLVTAMTAQMLVLAERFDGGRFSEARFESEKAVVFANYRTQVLQRENSAAVADAAQAQAWAAQQAATPRSVTCNRFGNTVTCY